MSLRALSRASLLVLAPLSFAIAQDVPDESGPISRSLLIREPGIGVLLPLGERGALQVSIGVSGSVFASSGGLSTQPRSNLDTELEVGYLRLTPSDERVRSYRYVRLGYRYQRNQPDPAIPAHTGSLSLGIGALAQVTRRVGLMADVGVQGSVRRQTTPPPAGFPGIPDTEQTTSSWGLVTGIGVTLRAKPRTAQAN